ncbi:hypothetical protein A2U01_0073707 [Trifolium medium]|uniref:Uncharacterized protein n=1 Tax=Trifolium medium TaxID=97028 RepID=A0A392SUF3_9FABA|nr:hypothetical protein [Trifolium medium]
MHSGAPCCLGRVAAWGCSLAPTVHAKSVMATDLRRLATGLRRLASTVHRMTFC